VRYLYYSAEDFAQDPAFRQWVQHPDEPVGRLFWEEWMAQHPDKMPEVDRARRLVQMRLAEAEQLSDAEKQLLWGQIQSTLSLAGGPAGAAPIVRRFANWRVAAAVLLLLTAGWMAWQWHQARHVIVQTSYGSTRRLLLPDRSVVVLNGNSTLSYRSAWPQDRTREVWLKGEAFFDVTHQRNRGNARFLVHTEGLTVEALGTQFNVSRRTGGARVVLAAGKVKLNVDDRPDNLYMHPGEVVELAAQGGKITRRVANPDLYVSWKNQELVFDHTPLAEIAKVLEDTYGRRVVFGQPALRGYRISGTIPSDNIEILLRALATSSGIWVRQRNNTIFIDNQNN